MISIQGAFKVFNKYVQAYDIHNPKVELKVKHTYSVVNKAKAIASSLSLEQEDIDLACLIALLHDIGRFEQLRIYNSFYDHQTVDHADLGVDILFKEKLIEALIDSREFDAIIYHAIKNHNKYQIEDGLSKRALLHANIIRDADKIDNLEIKCTMPLETVFDKGKEEIEKQTITPEVFSYFKQHTTVLSTLRKTDLDVWLSHLAFVFDFHFPYCFKEVIEQNYIDTLYHRLAYQNPKTKQQMQEIYQEVINYCKQKAKQV